MFDIHPSIFLVCSILVFSLISCAKMDSSRVYLNYPKTNSKTIQIINQLPEQNYVLVADFQCVDASTGWIKARAASYGADAVFVASFAGSTTQTGAVLSQGTANSGMFIQQFCSAIKFLNVAP